MPNDAGVQEERHRRLRRMARQKLQGADVEVESLSAEDLRVLIHEFGVYQAELEAQNEELRETRERLDETRDRYRDLYEFAPVGYLTLDAEGFIREINLEGSRLLGLPRGQLVGRELAALLEEGSARRLRELLGGKEPGSLEVEAGAGLGRRTLRGQVAHDENGENDGGGYWVALLDVTDTRRAEQALARSEARFRTLAATSPLGIFEADSRGRFTWVNERWSAITGLPAAKSLDYGWKEAVHPDDRREVAGQWAGRVGEGPWVQEFRLRRADGGEAWGRMLSAPTGMRAGRPTGYVGTLEEITAARRLEAELRRAKELAEETSRIKSEFLANMSHEIRTPMTVTLGALELLETQGLTGEQEKILQMAKTSSESLRHLIDDILDFSRIEAGKLELDVAPCDFRPLLETIISFFSLEAQRKGIELSLETAPDLPPILACDRKRLQQVLFNLVGNALKFTERGEVVLSAGREGNRLRLVVRDTGIGIPPDKRDRLFESFSQVDASRTRRYGGTGLGLAISQGLVALMGGRIEVASQMGDGSTFTVFLPLQTEDSENPAAPGEVETASLPAATLDARVLLAEDDPMVRHMLETMLRQWGCEVISADSGEEVVRVWEREHCQLILMDLQMPGLDGLQATGIIRRLEQQTGTRVPIVALTAHVRPEDRERCREAGMDDFVVKPIDSRRLRQVIEEQTRF